MEHSYRMELIIFFIGIQLVFGSTNFAGFHRVQSSNVCKVDHQALSHVKPQGKTHLHPLNEKHVEYMPNHRKFWYKTTHTFINNVSRFKNMLIS